MAEQKEEITIPEVSIVNPPEGYSAEEWSRLSDTEKEGIVESLSDTGEEETGDIDEKTLKEIAEEGEKPAGEKAGEKEKEGEKPSEEQPPQKEEEIPEKPEEKEAKPEEKQETELPTDEDLLAYRPTVSFSELGLTKLSDIPVPAEMESKLTALKTEREEGNLTPEEYQDKRDAIRDEIAQYRNDVWNQEREQKTEGLMWQRLQKAFFAARPEYMEKDGDGNYTPKAEILFGAFDKMATTLAKAHGLDMALLIRADQMVKETLGIKAPGPEKKPAEAKETDKPPAKKPPEMSTLGDIPDAGKNSTEDGWGAVDKLRGPALEAWLEKQPDAVRERYLDSLAGR